VWTPPQIDESIKSRAWDDSKLKEHYAIIPLTTKKSVDGLTTVEKTVYRMICRQYVAQFLPCHEYEATTQIFEIEKEKFRVSGKVPIVEGWMVLYGGNAASKNHDPDAQDELPHVATGDKGWCVKTELVEAQTVAPKRFTAITLLEAMEKAYLFVTDPKVKARLKQVEGIGTAATRAAVITKIVESGFAEEGKSGKVISYIPTAKAFQYIRCVPNVLSKPDLTAWFEGKLEEIVNGTLEYSRYRTLLQKLVEHTLVDAKSGEAKANMPSAQEVAHLVPEAKKPKTKKAVTKRSVANKGRSK
jgi:DNA topoisomerase-3